MTERAPQPIKRPRRLGACAAAILDLLQERGITGAQFFKTKHARVEFTYQGRALVYHFPTTPRDDGFAVKRHTARVVKLIEGAE